MSKDTLKAEQLFEQYRDDGPPWEQPPASPVCSEEHCERQAHLDGLCKRHRDTRAYQQASARRVALR
jgi:hypothetical protein